MPAVKRRYYILIFITILLLAGWSVRLQLATFIITSVLEQAGLENVTASIQDQGLTQTKLSRLSFTVPNHTEHISIDAQDFALNYQPGKLISGHIDTLEIGSLLVKYQRLQETPETADKKQSAPSPQMILGALKKTLETDLGKYVFFKKLKLRQLTLHGEIFDVLAGKPLSLKSDYDGDSLQTELSLLRKKQNTTDLPQRVITRLDKDGLELEIGSAQDTGKLPVKIQLSLTETVLNGRYRLAPPALQHWLKKVYGKKNWADFKLPQFNHKDSNKNSEIVGTLSLDFEDKEVLYASVTSTANHLLVDAYDADKLALDVRLAYSVQAGSHNLKLLDGSYLSARNISSGATHLDNSRIKFSGELSSKDNNWKYQGRISSESLIASHQSQQLKLADIEAEIDTDTRQLKVHGKLSPETLPGQFSFKLAHDTGNSVGSVSLKPVAAIDLSSETDKLSKLLTPWPYPFDLYTGKINLEAQAAWSSDKETRLNSRISVDDAGGSVNAILFSGLTLDHQLKILPTLKSAQSSEINLNTVDSGVTISNIKLQLAATTSKKGPLPRLIIRQTQGEILGGTFDTEELLYDPNLNKNSILIKVHDIDLAEVVKTQQLDNITATGRLDGKLPIEITKDGINIADGGLNNQIRGGTIRYTPESGTEQLKQNPITGLTLDALKDFRYSDLQAHVSYLPNGTLTVNLELKGISPEVDKKRPVELNINTEQNLVSLLESLRFAQGVSDNIDAQVRKMYEQSQNKK